MGRVKDLLPDEPTEGAACPMDDCRGTLQFLPVVGCSCHINPPCGACIDNPLTCNVCGEEFKP